MALIDIGSKSEAVLDVAELKDDDGALEAAVGDRIFRSRDHTVGGLTLSRKLVRKAASDKEVEDAYHARMPVEGVVQGVVKGGYEVEGRAQPRLLSVLPNRHHPHRESGGPRRQGVPLPHRGIQSGGGTIVVSRRPDLEEDSALGRRNPTHVVPDAVLPGRVVSVREYGAFVNLGGGMQGLLHVSEMGWSRVADSSALAVGDEIAVKSSRSTRKRKRSRSA